MAGTSGGVHAVIARQVEVAIQAFTSVAVRVTGIGATAIASIPIAAAVVIAIVTEPVAAPAILFACSGTSASTATSADSGGRGRCGRKLRVQTQALGAESVVAGATAVTAIPVATAVVVGVIAIAITLQHVHLAKTAAMRKVWVQAFAVFTVGI